MLEDTVSGKRNIYPWILSGCSMYRRYAIEEAGLFDEELAACEDVDLAWRVFLLGYQLAYEGDAEVVHYDNNPWPAFIKKGMIYGRAAAQLSYAYREHGVRNKFEPERFWRARGEQKRAAFYYWLGYSRQDLKLRLSKSARPPAQHPRPVRAEFRPVFSWTCEQCINIDSNTVFWLRDSEYSSVLVHAATKTRLVLDGVSDFIWRRLVACSSRAELVAEISACYNVSAATAAADLDEFMEELVACGVVVLLPRPEAD